jgi:hypothetical protein
MRSTHKRFDLGPVQNTLQNTREPMHSHYVHALPRTVGGPLDAQLQYRTTARELFNQVMPITDQTIEMDGKIQEIRPQLGSRFPTAGLSEISDRVECQEIGRIFDLQIVELDPKVVESLVKVVLCLIQ